ncbi:MAG: O-methyltransferase [Ardenticatenia bacterium]|nr:MAG: O-methyltransferase [Ardenticatenia bacterium]
MTIYNDALSTYISNLFAAEDDVLRQIRANIEAAGLPMITIRPEEGRFLQLLVMLTGGRRVLEIGTLGGYSGTWLARGLAPEGRLWTLEKSSKHAEVARANFALAGVSEQIEIVEGDAHQLLPKMAVHAPFDLVFIDAEKEGYTDYYAWAVEHVRLGGVIAAHNAFAQGRIANEPESEAARNMDAFNRMVSEDSRVEATIFPAGDGTLIAVRR